ncbi:MAG: proline racemase family protein [Bacteroidetes bacterium]|nr:proline racemase family protein [Bacteroidota bacterium]
MHTEGEPLRILTGGLPKIEGQTILEKRRFVRDKLDYIRSGIIYEPRGHADMYGAILTEPERNDSDIGVIFLHNDGYSTMCGHAIIALTKFIIESGWIPNLKEPGVLKLDVPAGQIIARFIAEGNVVKQTSFNNVPSFVYKKDQSLNIKGLGNIRYDIAFGGAFYAFCDAKDWNLKLDPSHYNEIIAAGKKMKQLVTRQNVIRHPIEPDLGFLYGIIFTSPPQNEKNHSRNVCIFANGELDRSPTGTGVSARAAIHFDNGDIKKEQPIVIESILGTTMRVKVMDTVKFGNYKAVIPEVSGRAWYTGRHNFYFDPADPLKSGFIIR